MNKFLRLLLSLILLLFSFLFLMDNQINPSLFEGMFLPVRNFLMDLSFLSGRITITIGGFRSLFEYFLPILLFGIGFYVVFVFALVLINLREYLHIAFQFVSFAILFCISFNNSFYLESDYNITFKTILLFFVLFSLLSYGVKQSRFYNNGSVFTKFLLLFPFVLVSFGVLSPSLALVYAIWNFSPVDVLTGHIIDTIYYKPYLKLKYSLSSVDLDSLCDQILQVLSLNNSILPDEAILFKAKICALVESGASIDVINTFIEVNKDFLLVKPVNDLLHTSPSSVNIYYIVCAVALVLVGGGLLFYIFKPKVAVRSRKPDSSNVPVRNVEDQPVHLPKYDVSPEYLQYCSIMDILSQAKKQYKEGTISIKLGPVIRTFTYDEWFNIHHIKKSFISILHARSKLNSTILCLEKPEERINYLPAPSVIYHINLNFEWLKLLSHFDSAILKESSLKRVLLKTGIYPEAGTFFLVPEARKVLYSKLKSMPEASAGLYEVTDKILASLKELF